MQQYKQQDSGGKNVLKSTDSKKMNSINGLQGIEPLEEALLNSTVRAVRSTTDTAIEASESPKSWADMVDIEEFPKLLGTQVAGDAQGTSWSRVVGPIPGTSGMNLQLDEAASKMVKITLEDVKDEVEYLATSGVCYVLGSNPPQTLKCGCIS
ncbi:hypothetical protein K7X08_023066 [Anisodus acutangulus]|uniref:Uncharacterized protein n=1 Tax=Anisodus acutangulus TaxID=402998 RepID=A0A9Q1RH12_9SOLA|nr:hypothetical protein K7X08_023066 [Anisodus acutangulus]